MIIFKNNLKLFFAILKDKKVQLSYL